MRAVFPACCASATSGAWVRPTARTTASLINRIATGAALSDRDAAADLAGHPVPLRDLLEHLFVLRARGHAERAARVEAAAGRRVDGARHVALEQDPLALHGGIGDRHGGEERLRVGVLRVGVELLRGRDLDDLAE